MIHMFVTIILYSPPTILEIDSKVYSASEAVSNIFCNIWFPFTLKWHYMNILATMLDISMYFNSINKHSTEKKDMTYHTLIPLPLLHIRENMSVLKAPFTRGTQLLERWQCTHYWTPYYDKYVDCNTVFLIMGMTKMSVWCFTLYLP